MLTAAISGLIIAGSCYMSFSRFRRGEKAYGIAWLVCAGVNAVFLLRYINAGGL